MRQSLTKSEKMESKDLDLNKKMEIGKKSIQFMHKRVH